MSLDGSVLKKAVRFEQSPELRRSYDSNDQVWFRSLGAKDKLKTIDRTAVPPLVKTHSAVERLLPEVKSYEERKMGISHAAGVRRSNRRDLSPIGDMTVSLKKDSSLQKLIQWQVGRRGQRLTPMYQSLSIQPSYRKAEAPVELRKSLQNGALALRESSGLAKPPEYQHKPFNQ